MVSRIKLKDGSYIRRVSQRKYNRLEQIRNYILRSNYERGVSISMATFKAMCRFKASENEIRQALYEWTTWFYGNGIRHRPIELFIQDDIERRQKEKWKEWESDIESMIIKH